jgi:hypothetical protein
MLSSTTNWPRLYAAAMLAGAALGVLLVLRVTPAVPQQLSGWLAGANNKPLTIIAPIACGALFGLMLAALSHLGVRWQLRNSGGRG